MVRENNPPNGKVFSSPDSRDFLGKFGLFSATASFRDGNANILNRFYSPCGGILPLMNEKDRCSQIGLQKNPKPYTLGKLTWNPKSWGGCTVDP